MKDFPSLSIAPDMWHCIMKCVLFLPDNISVALSHSMRPRGVFFSWSQISKEAEKWATETKNSECCLNLCLFFFFSSLWLTGPKFLPVSGQEPFTLQWPLKGYKIWKWPVKLVYDEWFRKTRIISAMQESEVIEMAKTGFPTMSPIANCWEWLTAHWALDLL